MSVEGSFVNPLFDESNNDPAILTQGGHFSLNVNMAQRAEASALGHSAFAMSALWEGGGSDNDSTVLPGISTENGGDEESLEEEYEVEYIDDVDDDEEYGSEYEEDIYNDEAAIDETDDALQVDPRKQRPLLPTKSTESLSLYQVFDTKRSKMDIIREDAVADTPSSINVRDGRNEDLSKSTLGTLDTKDDNNAMSVEGSWVNPLLYGSSNSDIGGSRASSEYTPTERTQRAKMKAQQPAGHFSLHLQTNNVRHGEREEDTSTLGNSLLSRDSSQGGGSWIRYSDGTLNTFANASSTTTDNERSYDDIEVVTNADDDGEDFNKSDRSKTLRIGHSFHGNMNSEDPVDADDPEDDEEDYEEEFSFEDEDSIDDEYDDDEDRSRPRSWR
jgi:hypothetical protein